MNAVISKTKHYAGNNPGSALAAVMMFLLVPALFISGIGYGGEELEELHEVFAWALLAVIVLHLAGLVWHTIRHRENISLAMVTGKKAGMLEDAIPSTHAAWGAVVAILAGAWIAALFAAHDARKAILKVPGIGVTLQLAENESDEGKHNRHHHDHDD
jgi:cytochrome b561